MSDPGDREPDDVDDEELAEMADELSTVLRELRDELRASREAGDAEPVEEPTAGGGTEIEFDVDLPSAADVLAFTDERLIPAAITILEVNIRALELLQKGIRWARPDRAGENARAVRSHAESVSRSTLQRLDTVLADLQDAAGEGALPENAEASGIITEARRLRDEIDHALADRVDESDDGPEELPDEESTDDEPDEDDEPSSPWGEQPEVDVDVEGELESIKAELGKVDEDGEDDVDDESADADDEPTDGDGDDEPVGGDGEGDDETAVEGDGDDEASDHDADADGSCPGSDGSDGGATDPDGDAAEEGRDERPGGRDDGTDRA